MSKSGYEEKRAEIAAKVKANNSTRHSKSDLVELTQALLNTPDQTFDVYFRDPDGKKPKTVTIAPVKRLRDSITNIAVKNLGVDKNEAGKLVDGIQFSRNDAEAFIDVATYAIKDYTGSGRKLIFPITGKDETQMEISQVRVPTKVSEIPKIVKGADDHYTRVMTGKKRTTAEHNALKATNKVMPWFVSDK